MKNYYDSKLHKFVKEYFAAKGLEIEIVDNNYFYVKNQNKEKQIYTYNPKIASENNSVVLIARSSNFFNQMLYEVKDNSAYSQFSLNYTLDSLKESMSKKSCCNLCPFISICDDKSGCCHFCNNYELCNTQILNAKFEKAGQILKQKKLTLIIFIYESILSNDYLLEHNSRKKLPILFDYETKKPVGELVLNNFDNLNFDKATKNYKISKAEYESLHEKSLDILKEKSSAYISLLKQQIQGPLLDKTKSIIDMYYTEYTQDYTKTKVKRIDELQKEALRFAKREIEGYSINTEYRLENVFIIETNFDTRNLIFSTENDNLKKTVEGNILLNRVDIFCESCGREIEKAYICENNHLICETCADICNNCEKILCPICQVEQIKCQTCNQTFCSDCINQCDSCKKNVCNDHIYKCDFCDKNLCLDCHEICSVCQKNICNDHVHYCHECQKPICPDHSIKCDTCGEYFCPDHINKCEVCNANICNKDTYISDYDNLKLCKDHIHTCFDNQITVSTTNSKTCLACGEIYCDNIKFKKCKLSTVELCLHCIDENNLSPLFYKFKKTDYKDLSYSHLDFDKNMSFKESKQNALTFILASKFLNLTLYVFQNDNFYKKIKISLIDQLKYRLKGLKL